MAVLHRFYFNKFCFHFHEQLVKVGFILNILFLETVFLPIKMYMKTCIIEVTFLKILNILNVPLFRTVKLYCRERSGSVVERLTSDQGVVGSSLIFVTVLCP